jgi:hypothetical protein
MKELRRRRGGHNAHLGDMPQGRRKGGHGNKEYF